MRLKGTRVMLAGTFDKRSREEFEQSLKKRGAEIASDIAPDVEVVFVGADSGYVADEARELGIPVRDEAALELALETEEQEPTSKPLPPAPDVVMEEPPPGHPAAMPVPDDARPASRPAPDDTTDDEGRSGEATGERVFEKGARVKIVSGTQGVGVVGNIFWWGESKFGEGMRAGVSGDDDETYWVDEEDLGWPDEEIPQEVLELAEEASAFGKGDRVRVKSGKHEGEVGTIFWWGESKWGDGMRAGINTDDDQTIWADAELLEKESTDGDDPIPF